MQKLKYTYSRLSSCSVSQLVALHYDLPEARRCKFYALGLHDNYVIEGDQEKYILRVYRNDWRSPDETHFELELLAFLGIRNAPIAAPLLTKANEFCFFLDCPEGKKAVALFNYADGFAPGNEISTEESALLGEAVAGVHQSTEMFETSCTRQVLNVPYLLDESILAIETFLGVEEKIYIKKLQKSVREALPSLTQETGVYGICLGDVNPTNFHINNNKDITLFDFDQCGYGFRAFEIGKFISSIHTNKNKHSLAKAFIEGYQQVRRLNPDEMDAIPWFEIISVIWVMAIHAYNVDRIGYKYLEKPFWDRRLAVLKELEGMLPDRPGGL